MLLLRAVPVPARTCALPLRGARQLLASSLGPWSPPPVYLAARSAARRTVGALKKERFSLWKGLRVP
eukprot:7374094-Pyramimonas_sp.AAC.1